MHRYPVWYEDPSSGLKLYPCNPAIPGPHRISSAPYSLCNLELTHNPNTYRASKMAGSQADIPVLKDLNIDNITENTIIINSQGDDPRMKYVMERLVTHLHDFARETRLSTSEWMAGLNFLVKVGQISSDVRHVRMGLHNYLNIPPALEMAVNTLPPYIGVYPPLRYSRPLSPRRCDRPSQTRILN